MGESTKLNSNFYFKMSWKEFILLILFWLLLYIEPLEIGAFKLSQIWKGLVVCFLLFYVLNKKIPAFILIGILFSFKYLIYTYLPYGFIRALYDALENLIFPLFLGLIYIKYRNISNSTEKLHNISILLSLFFIYQAIPFLFGLENLHPTTQTIRQFERWGIDETALRGLFHGIAVSSKMFTVSTIVLLNSYKRFSNNNLNRLFWLISILLGSYFVFISYARTAWVIYFVAFIVSLFYNTKLNKKLTASVIGMLLIIGILYLYETHDAFRWRITGEMGFPSYEGIDIENIAYSRLGFIEVAIDNLREEGLAGQLLGYGTIRGHDLFYQKTGMAISSHNETFKILESSGILGLILYVVFICILFSKVMRNSKYTTDEIKKLSFLSITMFLGFYFSGHKTPFWGEIIYACFFIGVLIEGKRKNGITNHHKIRG